jgi:nicotinamide-nucleotide amidase
MPQEQSAPAQLWTPANKVTLLRILLIPVFVVAIVSPWPEWFPQWPEAEIWKPWVAALVFVVIAATDFIDGHLARSRNEVTDLGKFMDPLADKILVAAALLALVELGPLPSWVALVILAREFIVSGIRMVAASKNVVIAASWYGKVKTVLQMCAIVLFTVKDSWLVASWGQDAFVAFYIFSWVVMIAALVMTIVSMLDYFSKAKHILGFTDAEDAQARAEEGAEGTDAIANDELAAAVVHEAARAGLTLGTAESCTGGMIAAALTSVPGSSAVLNGGIVSYTNPVKHRELGVAQETLDAHGAVSEETACEMARGARSALSTDLAVSVTGIAGPGGAEPGKPVGTVWIGLADGDAVSARVFHFEGNRAAVRAKTVHEALDALRAAIEARTR